MRVSRKIFHQALACTPAIFTQFLLGIGWGWTAPTLLKLQSGESDFRITVAEAAWLASISEAGRIVGPFIAPIILDSMGRKKTSTILGFVHILIWSTAIYVRDINVLLATRIAFGLANGVTDVASSIYITEVCSPELRGFGGTAIVLSFFCGLILENFLCTYTSFTNSSIVNTILSVCAICSQYFGVETTYFLVMKGKHEQAKKNLVWLQANPEVDEELKKIEKNVEEQKQKRESVKRLLSSGTNLKAMFAAVGFYLLFSCVGFHTVTPYASFIFSPSETFTSNEYTILFGIAQLIAAIFSLFFVEKFDRRPLLIICFVIVTCCNITTVGLLYLRGKNYDIPFYPWLLFLCLALYGFVASFMSPVVYVLVGELLPLSVRALGGSLAVSVSSTVSFITAILFWPITGYFGMEANFIIYSCVSFLNVFFIYYTIPETRGKSLHEMYEKQIKMGDL